MKTTDVTERTLEKEKKDYIFLCEIMEVGFIFIIIICIAMMIINIGSFIASIKEYDMPYAVIALIVNEIILFSGAITSNFASKIFKKLKDGETPFRYEIADKMKAIGISICCGTLIAHILEFVIMILTKVDVIGESTPDIMNFSLYTLFGVISVIIAYIFNYGCKLQKESDETL